MSVEMAQSYYSRMADPNWLGGLSALHRIHEAVVRGHQELVEFFLAQGADLNTGALKDGDLTYFIA